jgi:pimeloyl-ACP methyl ester carboxylesterase
MTTNPNFRSEALAALCAVDGEFQLAARYWTGGLRLLRGEEVVALRLTNGAVAAGDPGTGPGVAALSATPETWDQLTAAKPPRFFNDIGALIGGGAMSLSADPVLFAQYYPAVMRAVELLRPADAAVAVATPKPAAPGTFDSPVGRYIHLTLEGQDHRIYFEEAGAGIPLLLQHTAGCHGSQWRHLFECKAITEHFRLIAYDLPFHGKSVPPVGPKWWAEEYKLKASFLRSVPLALSTALGLNRPVFMGCSVGGVLALDLARHHPEAFRTVISLEGGLKIGGDIEAFSALWHPQVSNEYKARLMNALMSPTSPEAYRKETSQVYAAGWPPVFLGDLYYYMVDYDLTGEADKIDTSKVAVHILSGEYDSSGTLEHGQAAHAAIAGSTWSGMNDVGHFPMSENPEVFLTHLLPVLETIKAGAAV